MVKIRLKRLGYKRNPIYRIVVINDRQKREGAPIAELGNYNPKTKEMKLNKELALEWVSKGAKPSATVAYLIQNADKDGSLIYKKKTEKKLSKKAIAKLEAEKEAKKKASEEAKAAKAAPAKEEVSEEAPAAEAETTAETPTEETVEAAAAEVTTEEVAEAVEAAEEEAAE